jgi:hypothetical protein
LGWGKKSNTFFCANCDFVPIHVSITSSHPPKADQGRAFLMNGVDVLFANDYMNHRCSKSLVGAFLHTDPVAENKVGRNRLRNPKSAIGVT